MPPTSDQLPLLGIYYSVTTCIVSLSTAMTVFTLNINNKGRRGIEVPELARKIFFKYIARILRIKIETFASHKYKLKENLYKKKLNAKSAYKDLLESTFEKDNNNNVSGSMNTTNDVNFNLGSKFNRVNKINKLK